MTRKQKVEVDPYSIIRMDGHLTFTTGQTGDRSLIFYLKYQRMCKLSTFLKLNIFKPMDYKLDEVLIQFFFSHKKISLVILYQGYHFDILIQIIIRSGTANLNGTYFIFFIKKSHAYHDF